MKSRCREVNLSYKKYSRAISTGETAISHPILSCRGDVWKTSVKAPLDLSGSSLAIVPLFFKVRRVLGPSCLLEACARRGGWVKLLDDDDERERGLWTLLEERAQTRGEERKKER